MNRARFDCHTYFYLDEVNWRAVYIYFDDCFPLHYWDERPQRKDVLMKYNGNPVWLSFLIESLLACVPASELGKYFGFVGWKQP